MKYFSFIAVLLVLLSGCAAVERTKVLPNDPDFSPILPEDEDSRLVPTGSLFNTHYVNSIYSDLKAHQVGDIILVTLSENTQANKSALTEYTKENSSTLKPVIGLGGNATINKRSIQLGINQKSDFSGDSASDQSNSLSGSISVHVIKVLPNGNLVIRGEKWMTLNSGDEYIRLTGTIRALDIDADNSILSTKVANARIQYSGTGTFADVQEQGWLSKFFNSMWWPW